MAFDSSAVICRTLQGRLSFSVVRAQLGNLLFLNGVILKKLFYIVVQGREVVNRKIHCSATFL